MGRFPTFIFILDKSFRMFSLRRGSQTVIYDPQCMGESFMDFGGTSDAHPLWVGRNRVGETQREKDPSSPSCCLLPMGLQAPPPAPAFPSSALCPRPLLPSDTCRHSQAHQATLPLTTLQTPRSPCPVSRPSLHTELLLDLEHDWLPPD